MFAFRLSLLLPLAACFLPSAVAIARNPTSEEVATLAAAAWQELPESVDVTFYIERHLRPMKPAEVEKSVRYAYDMTDKDAPKTSSEEREKDIAAEVKRIIQERQQPRYSRQRVRTQGHLYRMDDTALMNENDQVSASPSNTYVNGGTGVAGDRTHFVYDHGEKTATLFTSKSRWQQQRVEEWSGMTTRAKILFKSMLGSVEQKEWIPSAEKMREAAEGAQEHFLLDINPVEGRQDRIKISVTFTKYPDNPLLVLVSDAQDCAKVYEAVFYDPQTGTAREKIQRDDFAPNGFAQSIHRVVYAKDGTITTEHKIIVEKLEVAPDFPEDLFRFRAPEGYAIVDRRFKTPLVVQPHEREIMNDVLERASVAAVKPKKTESQNLGGSPQSIAKDDNKAQLAPAPAAGAPTGAGGQGRYAWVVAGVALAALCSIILLAWRRRRTRRIAS